MWFKNIRLYQFQTPLLYDPEELESKLAQGAFQPCPKSHAHSYGWVSPLGDEHSLVFGQHGCMMIKFRVEEKVLPAGVVRENLQIKVKELEQNTGRRIYKDEKERLKDELYQTLLTKAFTKSTYVNGFIDTQKNWLVIDGVSSKKISYFISMLMRSTGNVVFAPEYIPIPQVLTQWLATGTYPSALTIGNACLLKDPDEKGSIVRVKNEDLFSDKIQAFLTDNSIVTQMTLEWGGNVRFTLKEDFTLSQVRFLDSVKDLARDGLGETIEERFASDFIIMTQTIAELMQDLQPNFIANAQEEDVEAVTPRVTTS